MTPLDISWLFSFRERDEERGGELLLKNDFKVSREERNEKCFRRLTAQFLIFLSERSLKHILLLINSIPLSDASPFTHRNPIFHWSVIKALQLISLNAGRSAERSVNQTWMEARNSHWIVKYIHGWERSQIHFLIFIIRFLLALSSGTICMINSHPFILRARQIFLIFST